MTDLFAAFYGFAPYALCGLCGLGIVLLVIAVRMFYWAAEKATGGNES